MSRKRTDNVDQAREIARELNLRHVYFFPAMRVLEEEYGDAIITDLPSRLVKAGPLPGLARRPRLEPRGALWAAITAGRGGAAGHQYPFRVETARAARPGRSDCRRGMARKRGLYRPDDPARRLQLGAARARLSAVDRPSPRRPYGRGFTKAAGRHLSRQLPVVPHRPYARVARGGGDKRGNGAHAAGESSLRPSAARRGSKGQSEAGGATCRVPNGPCGLNQTSAGVLCAVHRAETAFGR